MARPIITTATLQLEKGFAQRFEANVIKELKKKFRRVGPSIAKRTEEAIQSLVTLRLSSSEVVNSLAGGQLRAEFGLVDGELRISNIIEIWANALNVTYFPMVGKLGSIVIVMDEAFVNDVINMPIASFVTENGSHLEWLRWLLLEGSAPIVGEYGFKSAPRGRTGQGIMVKKTGKSWSVPAQFQGVENNNFVTEALEGIETEIQGIIRREFVKGI
tara:strand:- start:14468 stop:15115 length:648 start_codon:yes stop_codon:yes gene_type:complete